MLAIFISSIADEGHLHSAGEVFVYGSTETTAACISLKRLPDRLQRRNNWAVSYVRHQPLRSQTTVNG